MPENNVITGVGQHANCEDNNGAIKSRPEENSWDDPARESENEDVLDVNGYHASNSVGAVNGSEQIPNEKQTTEDELNMSGKPLNHRNPIPEYRQLSRNQVGIQNGINRGTENALEGRSEDEMKFTAGSST